MKTANVKMKLKMIKTSGCTVPSYYLCKWILCFKSHQYLGGKKKHRHTLLTLMQGAVAIWLRQLLTNEHRFRSCSVIPIVIQGKEAAC